jgi:16S rRNA processing protein RimM
MIKNIVIAKINSAFGIKGLIKLTSFTNNPVDFIKYSGKVFDQKGQKYELKIVNQIPNKNNNSFIIQIPGITDRTQAELLSGVELLMARDNLRNTNKDEFYYIDLIGLDVINVDQHKIGKVIAVNDFGAGGIVEIKFDANFDNPDKLENFSFTNQNFPTINLEKGFLILNLPEMIEINS